MTKECRPRDHLNAASQLYPEAWRTADQLRADIGTGDLPNWPTWCYLPMAGWYAIACKELQVPTLSIHTVSDVGRLAALGAWRCTQGIYRFDTALYDAVRETPVSGDIPCEVLYHLPEWCVYIETPDMQWRDGRLHGYWAHLEWDDGTGRPEIRLLLDADSGLDPIPLHLGKWPLLEAIQRMLKVSQGYAAPAYADRIETQLQAGMQSDIAKTVEPLISLLLFLCSQAGEIGDGQRRPANPTPKRTKHGLRMFPAERITTWDVGVRIGAALRAAYHAEQTHQGGTHNGPRPHIRRAHWHGYWSGPIDAEHRKYDLRWLPPIPVNTQLGSNLPAVIRPVK